MVLRAIGDQYIFIINVISILSYTFNVNYGATVDELYIIYILKSCHFEFSGYFLIIAIYIYFFYYKLNFFLICAIDDFNVGLFHNSHLLQNPAVNGSFQFSFF